MIGDAVTMSICENETQKETGEIQVRNTGGSFSSHFYSAIMHTDYIVLCITCLLLKKENYTIHRRNYIIVH